MTNLNEEFPELMKSWRRRAGISQLELSLRCEVSQKHISFLELARSSPSQDMVLRLCDAMSVPLRDRNSLLMAAGFAPGYRESELSAPELAAVDQALDMMLEQQEPFPAVVIDRLFNIVRANVGAMKFQAFMFGTQDPAQMPPEAGNLLRALFHKDGIRRYVKNWEDIALFLLRQAYAESMSQGGHEELKALIRDLERSDGVPRDWRQRTHGYWAAPMLTLDVEKDGIALKFFSTVATLGTPMDVTLQEIRIENYFPADAATRNFFLSH